MRTFEVDLGSISPGSLSFGDLIDVSDATGIEPDAMQGMIGGDGKGADRLRLLVGFAWIIARRKEPELTYADVLAGQVKVTGRQDRTGPVRKRGGAA